MKTYRLIKFKEHLKGGYNIEDLNPNLWTSNRKESWAHLYMKYARSFNTTTLFYLIITVSFLGSLLGSQVFLRSFLSFSILGIFLYFYSRALAEGFDVQRKVPALGHENKDLVVEYIFWNASPFHAYSVEWTDEFTGHSPKKFSLKTQGCVPSQVSMHLEMPVRCNAEMGRHKFSKISLLVHDPLGIFQHLVEFEIEQETVVLPQLIPLLSMSKNPAIDSLRYGIQESFNRGSSINFRSLRDFARGDSKKHIAWRASAKHNTLLVKEFERQVNSHITLFLNLDAKVHIGDNNLSTWELAKDLSLSLIQEELNLGNTVSFLTPQSQMRTMETQEAFNEAIYNIMDLKPSRTDGYLSDHIMNNLESFPRGTTLAVVSPFFYADFNVLKKISGVLKDEGSEMVFILLDTVSFAQRILTNEPTLKTAFAMGSANFQGLLNQFKDLQCRTFIIRVGEPLARSLARVTDKFEVSTL